MQAPAEIRIGQPFDVKVSVDSTTETKALLRLDRNGVIVEETAGLGSKDEIEAHIKKTIASGAAPTAGGQ